MSVSTVSLKGKREDNEDKHVVMTKKTHNTPVNFYAIFDGHGGKFVSTFLAETLPKFFVNKKVIYPLKKSYVTAVYNYIQSLLIKKHKRAATQCGSTSLVAIHYKKPTCDYLYILNTGDCRSVLCRGGKALNLSEDHKPNTKREKARITKLGGKIEFDGFDYRIKDLSVSRSFGDLNIMPYVTHLPEIYKYRLNKSDKFFIMGCDGLWDVMTSQEAVNFVLINCYDRNGNKNNNASADIAKKLGMYALQKGSMDNVTALVTFF